MKIDYKKDNITGLSNAIDIIGVIRRHLDSKNFDRFLAAIDREEYIPLPEKVISEILEETAIGKWIQNFQRKHKRTLDMIFIDDDITYTQLVLNVVLKVSIERLKETEIISHQN